MMESIDLVGRMETKDKIAQLGHTAPGIDSLKIPAYQWWSEALHGIAGSPGVHFGGNVSGLATYIRQNAVLIILIIK